MSNQKPKIDWEPAPGYVLIKPLDREELNRSLPGSSTLKMPDDMEKVSDHTGVGEVVKTGCVGPAEVAFMRDVFEMMGSVPKGSKVVGDVEDLKFDINPGDLIAFMPYTDKLLEIGIEQYSLVGYRQIMGVLKKGSR